MNRLIELDAYLEALELGRGKQIRKFAKLVKRKGVDEDGRTVISSLKFPKKMGWKAKHIKKYRKMTERMERRRKIAER